jgi:hypothetical protein
MGCSILSLLAMVALVSTYRSNDSPVARHSKRSPKSHVMSGAGCPTLSAFFAEGWEAKMQTGRTQGLLSSMPSTITGGPIFRFTRLRTRYSRCLQYPGFRLL